MIVTDPTYSGIGVAVSAGRLARDLGIPSVHLVVNRVRNDADRERVADDMARRGGDLRFDTLAWVPYDDAVLAAEPAVDPLLADPDSPFMTAVRALAAIVSRTPTEIAP